MTIAVAIAALLGFLDTGYLLWKRYGRPGTPLICPIGENCQQVLDSRYGSLLGFRNEFLGLGYYALLLLALALAKQGSALTFKGAVIEPLGFAMIIAAVAFIFSTALTAIQIFVLKNYCSYCLFANGLNAFIFIALVLR